MKKKNKESLSATQKLSKISGVPIDMMLTKQPYITLFSNREITVEDAGKLIHYDDKNVKVMQGKTAVSVNGSGLGIKCLANGDLRVEGYITSLEFVPF